MAVGDLACALSGNFSALFTWRVLQGVGVGGEMPVAATYINELSRAQHRGRFFLAYELIFPLGFLAAGILGAQLVPVYGWQSLFVLGTIPGFIITVLLLRLPESPRWLISKGRLKEAEAIIRQIEASTDKRIAGGGDAAHVRAEEERLERAVLARLSEAHLDRLDDLGHDVRDHERNEQLDADDLHVGLRAASARSAESRVSYQCDAGARAHSLHLRHRHRRAPSLDDGHASSSAGCCCFPWGYSAPAM